MKLGAYWTCLPLNIQTLLRVLGELFQIFGICLYLMIGYGSKCYGTCRKPRENGASFSQMTIKRVYKDIIVFLPPLSKVGFLFSLISDIK